MNACVLKASTLVTVIAPLLVLTGSGRAQAALFTGNSHGVWETPNPGTNATPQFSGVHTSTFTWGTPSAGVDANQLIFAGNTFTTDVDTLFQVGSLTYTNRTVLTDTVVDSVPLTVTLSFVTPGALSESFSFDFHLVSTPNTSTDPEANADFVYPIHSTGDRSFNLGGIEYTLSLIGFLQPSSSTPVTEFRVLEDATTTAALFGRIIAVPPEHIPESEPILGLLLIGLLPIVRRQRLKQHTVKN